MVFRNGFRKTIRFIKIRFEESFWNMRNKFRLMSDGKLIFCCAENIPMKFCYAYFYDGEPAGVRVRISINRRIIDFMGPYKEDLIKLFKERL